MSSLSYAEQLRNDLFRAYEDARKNKRNTIAQLEFEKDAEHNLIELYHELLDGSYVPGKSICFLTHFPVLREVFASQVPQYSSTSISQVVTKSPSHISDTPTREEKGAR